MSNAIPISQEKFYNKNKISASTLNPFEGKIKYIEKRNVKLVK